MVGAFLSTFGINSHDGVLSRSEFTPGTSQMTVGPWRWSSRESPGRGVSAASRRGGAGVSGGGRGFPSMARGGGGRLVVMCGMTEGGAGGVAVHGVEADRV